MWRRPESVPIGQVWSRFKGKGKDGVPGKAYQIRDLEDKYQKQCVDLMTETFMRDEPICNTLGLKSDPTSIRSIQENWRRLMAQGVSLACFTEVDGEPQELIGFNVLYVASRGDPAEDIDNVEGEVWRKVLKTLVTAERKVDVFTHYGVDIHLGASGLTVLPQYRGQNIGGHIIAARQPLCKALNIGAVSTVFTAKASQVLAVKCGYQLLATLHYEDMKRHGVDLTECSTSYAEVRGIRVST